MGKVWRNKYESFRSANMSIVMLVPYYCLKFRNKFHKIGSKSYVLKKAPKGYVCRVCIYPSISEEIEAQVNHAKQTIRFEEAQSAPLKLKPAEVESIDFVRVIYHFGSLPLSLPLLIRRRCFLHSALRSDTKEKK